MTRHAIARHAIARHKRAPQLLCDDLPIFAGTPIMVPDPTRPKTETAPESPTPPIDKWGWCGSLLESDTSFDTSFDSVAE